MAIETPADCQDTAGQAEEKSRTKGRIIILGEEQALLRFILERHCGLQHLGCRSCGILDEFLVVFAAYGLDSPWNRVPDEGVNMFSSIRVAEGLMVFSRF